MLAADDPSLRVKLRPATADGGAELQLINTDPRHPLTVAIDDLSYGSGQRLVNLGPAGGKRATANVTLELARSFGWYDLGIHVQNTPLFEQRYAGHIETGRESFSDPRMGRSKA